MPENTMRIDRHMPGTRLDWLVTQTVTEILNAMLDTEADEIAGRPDTSVPADGRRTARAATSTCPGLKARRRKRTDYRATGGHDQKSAQSFGHYRVYGRFLPMAHHIQRCTKRFARVSSTSARAVAARPARSCENHGADATSMPMIRKSPIFMMLSVNAFSA